MRVRWFGFVVIAILGLVAVWPGAALAHERRDVGPNQWIVGWQTEPAIEGEKNAVSLRVSALEGGQPVEGLQDSLQVEVTHVPSGMSRTFALEPVFGQAGAYQVNLFPTAPGHYRFRFFGSVGNVQVNETFDSRTGGGGFDDVVSAGELQFPIDVASVQQIEGAARGAAASAQEALVRADNAADDASSARAAGVAGVVLGAVGVLMGGGALLLAVRRR